MRTLSTAVLLLAALAPNPSLADDGRVEARGGVVFGSGDSEGVAGIAAGYDFDLGGSAFLGGEVSGDKILQDNTRIVLGLTGRAGIKAGENTRLFATGGYSTKPCRFCENSLHAGAGAEFALSSSIYGKVEYRHFFVDNGGSDFDSAVVGVGFRF